VVVPCSGEYNPVLSTRQEYETLKLNFVDVLLEQTQGGRALASNSYSYGGHFVHSLRLGTGGEIDVGRRMRRPYGVRGYDSIWRRYGLRRPFDTDLVAVVLVGGSNPPVQCMAIAGISRRSVPHPASAARGRHAGLSRCRYCKVLPRARRGRTSRPTAS
jgi:hypothetical protein